MVLPTRHDGNPGELSGGGPVLKAASRGNAQRYAERLGEGFEGDLDFLATDGTTFMAARIGGDELGDEVGPRDAGG
jgi:hypothetical protein